MERILRPSLEYQDYASMPADGKIYEVLDGDLSVTPAPSPHHQRTSKRLQRQLEDYFETGRMGEIFDAPIDVILSRHDIVQPDLVLVTDPSLVSGRGIEGAPTLLVEVLSPSSTRQDRVVKARRYAALGVPHYWMVDPDARRVECYRARQGAYALVAAAEGEAALEHTDWPGLTIRFAELWS
jgi:Uma2 family endonuclease